MRHSTAWLLFASVLASACAARSFQPQFTPPAAPKQPVVLSELIKPRPRTEQPVLVGLTTDPMRLFAWDLERGLLWEQPVAALSAPLVAADAIVMQEPDGVIVRDLATGRRRVVVDERGKLVSADGEAPRLVVIVAYDEKAAPGAVALVEGDSVRWKQQLSLPVGVAALSGDYVTVPWATQRLSVLAASDGRELARHHFKSSVMGHALVDRGQLYVGQLGLTPVSSELLEQPSAKHAPYTPLKRSLPGQPPLLRDGYLPVPEPDNAQHRLQVGWRIHAGASGPSSENGLFMLRFYRLLFALDANADAVRWVRTFDHDLVGAAIQPGGLLLVDAGGTLRWLDTTGNTRAIQALGRELRVATLRPGSYVPGGAPAAAADSEQVAPVAGAGAAATGAPPAAASVQTTAASTELPILEPIAASLREQLFVAASLADDRLGAGRAYAVSNLARFPEADATSELIALCAERKSPEPVRVAACAQLRERTSGEAAVLATLRVRASFLEGTDAPPVGPLAQAAAKMQLKQAGALLVSHVEDPNTPARDLVAVFEALQGLGERSAAASVERFVRLHHAEPAGSELLPALASALRTLATLRAQRQTLVDVAADPLTPLPTREQAKAALALLDAPPPTAASEAQARDDDAKPRADEVQTDPRPYALGPEVVRKALAPVRERLGRCLLADASRPHSGRTTMVIDATGRVEGVFVMPATLQPCVEPVLREARFPATRLGRQRITHIFTQPNAPAPAPAKIESKRAARVPVKSP